MSSRIEEYKMYKLKDLVYVIYFNKLASSHSSIVTQICALTTQ